MGEGDCNPCTTRRRGKLQVISRRSSSRECLHAASPEPICLALRQALRTHKTHAAHAGNLPARSGRNKEREGLLARCLRGFVLDGRLKCAIAPACLSACTADRCHVLTVAAHDFPTLLASVPCLVGGELVRSALR